MITIFPQESRISGASADVSRNRNAARRLVSPLTAGLSQRVLIATGQIFILCMGYSPAFIAVIASLI